MHLRADARRQPLDGGATFFMENCIKCGEPIIRRHTKGYCHKCYMRQYHYTKALKKGKVFLKDDSFEGEVWKDINGFIGQYQVSCFARVKSLERLGTKGKILKQRIGTTGYYIVNLKKPNSKKIKTAKIHRLVAEAFISNPNNLPQVNHKDGNKLNSYAYNLEWTTQKENVHHAFRTGLVRLGVDRTQSKLTKEQILEIKALHKKGRQKGHKRKEINPFSSRSLGFKYNVSADTIRKVVNNLSYKNDQL